MTSWRVLFGVRNTTGSSELRCYSPRETHFGFGAWKERVRACREEPLCASQTSQGRRAREITRAWAAFASSHPSHCARWQNPLWKTSSGPTPRLWIVVRSASLPCMPNFFPHSASVVSRYDKAAPHLWEDEREALRRVSRCRLVFIHRGENGSEQARVGDKVCVSHAGFATRMRLVSGQHSLGP